MRVVELLVSASLMWAPPTGAAVEGPAPNDEGETEGETEGEPSETDEFWSAPDDDGDLGESGEPQPDGGESSTTRAEVDAIVDDAAQAAKDRAWLERQGREIDEYVRHLDALADVNAELDGCGSAIQAELRMALALAYLKADGTCALDGDIGEDEAKDVGDLPMPVLECFEAESTHACSDRLLEHVAEFADEGKGGTSAPFSQAFGCPHAAAQMSVEQMFGRCLADEYETAIDRFEGRPVADDREVTVWPIPRWASITGVAGGAALVITGAVLLGIDGKCPGGADPMTQAGECPSVYNTDTGGAVLLSIGALAMVGMGTVLVVTELQRKNKRRRESAFRRKIDRAEQLTGLRLSLPRPRLGLRP